MKKLEVSNVQIIPLRNAKDGLVAFCSFLLNESVYVGDVGIHTCLGNGSGYRLVYPERKTLNGDLIPCVYPINRETGRMVEEAVIAKYKSIVEVALKRE